MIAYPAYFAKTTCDLCRTTRAAAPAPRVRAAVRPPAARRGDKLPPPDYCFVGFSVRPSRDRLLFRSDDSQDAKRRPLKTFTQGDVSASVWSRDHLIKGQPTRFYSVTFERSYRDSSRQIRYTRSFNPDDLGTLMSLCQQAGDYLTSLQYPEAEGKE